MDSHLNNLDMSGSSSNIRLSCNKRPQFCKLASSQQTMTSPQQHIFAHNKPNPFTCRCASTNTIHSRRLELPLATLLTIFACMLAAMTQPGEAANLASARYSVQKQMNQYFLNEFCNPSLKAFRRVKNYKQANDTLLFLSSKATGSSIRLMAQKQMPGGPQSGAQLPADYPSIYKPLNCSIIVAAPADCGLVVTVNSVDLPKNLTQLGLHMNFGTNHSQHFKFEGENPPSAYFLTKDAGSKISINLHSDHPIDWAHISFDILLTVYRTASNNTGCPNENWFDCGDDICVPASLVCDRNKNCPNGADELMSTRCYMALFWSIAASSGLVLVLVIMVVIVVVVVHRRRGRLNKQMSLSDNILTGPDATDYIISSKLDLTQHANSALQGSGSNRRGSSYMASNLYLSGFENPVWTNGTLTKSQSGKPPAEQTQSAATGHRASEWDSPARH